MGNSIFVNCKKIGNDGITEVEAPAPIQTKPPSKKTNSEKKTGKHIPNKTKNPLDAVKKQLEDAHTVLDNIEESGIRYQERTEVLKQLIRATDTLRCLIPEDEPGEEEELDTLICVWKERGYYVEKTDLGIKLVLPPVLHKKEKAENVDLYHMERRFCMDDIGRFLQKEKDNLGLETHFLKDQVIVFTHERTRKGNFDYDNLSTSAYINAISDIFLDADTVSNIDFFQRFVRGEENRTIVHIIPKDNFAKWVKSRY